MGALRVSRRAGGEQSARVLRIGHWPERFLTGGASVLIALACVHCTRRLLEEPDHSSVRPASGRKRQSPHFACNTTLRSLKAALTGTIHAAKFAKYAARYLAQVRYRLNGREDRLTSLPGWCVPRRLRRPTVSARFGLLSFIAKSGKNLREEFGKCADIALT